ncbi:hypothetical protein DFH07DRAFT_791029 [Mycena maculata]|uniref:Uncharacterized protein n=1 Tax=Mycena maculata TaxID=230809 RepID=A0AAD7KC40_9AGAR|nr:hypothetical protein DFH07DRAFT_791029 [Mycena maculata]
MKRVQRVNKKLKDLARSSRNTRAPPCRRIHGAPFSSLLTIEHREKNTRAASRAVVPAQRADRGTADIPMPRWCVLHLDTRTREILEDPGVDPGAFVVWEGNAPGTAARDACARLAEDAASMEPVSVARCGCTSHRKEILLRRVGRSRGVLSCLHFIHFLLLLPLPIHMLIPPCRYHRQARRG